MQLCLAALRALLHAPLLERHRLAVGHQGDHPDNRAEAQAQGDLTSTPNGRAVLIAVLWATSALVAFGLASSALIILEIF